MMLPLDYSHLKERQRSERENYPENLSLRVHRALSWLHRAESCENDLDGQFIFLWISFNAAYAQDLASLNLSEAATFSKFVTKICDLDQNKGLTNLVWDVYPSSIRLLLDNQYVFQLFWDHQNGHDNAANWQEKFDKAKQQANTALAKQQTDKIIELVLTRLYTLRNQIIHGGATWNSQVNRSQLLDGANLMGKLVPIIIEVMMDNPQALWGDANYPVVG
ncbi:MAG: hypothetical protein ACI8XG_001851 [Congregibacter sp.]|jgi:hypothetical protein